MGLRISLGVCLAVSLGAANGAAAEAMSFEDPQWSFSVFAGQMANDGWETIVLDPTEIEWLDSNLAAAVIGRDWTLGNPRLRFGFEGQLVKHWGDQDHYEISVPLTVRYRALDPWIPLQGASFGLGLSWASEVPKIEVERKGESQQVLAHWYAEVEFGRPDWVVYPFLRLHHRSDGYVIADFDTGSNGVVFGLRYPF